MILMTVLTVSIQTPWKLFNEVRRALCLPFNRFYFWINQVSWNSVWKIYGTPIIQKHRGSTIQIGEGLELRCFTSSNPLAPFHPTILSTRNHGANLIIGKNFSMTGGSIVATTSITIGNNVMIGANSLIIDTDFHPLDPVQRKKSNNAGRSSPVVIEDDVFIGTQAIILKGTHIGKGSVIAAGATVSKNVPAGSIYRD